MLKLEAELEHFLSELIAVKQDGWREHAACVDTPSVLWFDAQHEQEAKQVCKDCPVRIQCLDNALEHNDQGIRGGLNDDERRSVFVHRRRNLQYLQADLERSL